jgi:hypothetical protein
MTIDSARLRTLIDTEIALLRDQRVVRQVRSLLVEPYVVMRDWDYGKEGEAFPCWGVLDLGCLSAVKPGRHYGSSAICRRAGLAPVFLWWERSQPPPCHLLIPHCSRD